MGAWTFVAPRLHELMGIPVPVCRPRRQRQPGHRLEAGPRPRAGRDGRGGDRGRGAPPGHGDPGAVACRRGRPARSPLAMAAVPITVPGVGESISEGILARWLKPDGSLVQAGEPLFELETDKASNVVPAPAPGVLQDRRRRRRDRGHRRDGRHASTPPAHRLRLRHPRQAQAASPAPASASAPSASRPAAAAAAPNDGTAAAADAGVGRSRRPSAGWWPRTRSIRSRSPPPAGRADHQGRCAGLPQAPAPAGDKVETVAPSPATAPAGDASPPAATTVQATGGDRSQDSRATTAGRETRQRMSGLRQRDRPAPGRGPADRRDPDHLQRSRHVAGHGPARPLQGARSRPSTASAWASCRSSSRRSIEALKALPSGQRPNRGQRHRLPQLLRHRRRRQHRARTDGPGASAMPTQLSFAAIEKAIAAYAEKAREGTIAVDDLQGGTFTITNGGIFGSLLSTPILNPPQSGILGMHAIKKRPVVVDDQIVDPADDVPGALLRSPHHRRPRGRQLPGPDQGVHREPRTVDAGDLNRLLLRGARFMTRGANGGTEYDLVVIGAGPGGYVAAIRAAQLGMKVACVEKRASLGGTCLNVGCIPSKAMLDSSELYHLAQERFGRHGIKVDGLGLDLAAMLARKDEVVKGLTDGVRFLFRKNKVEAIFGAGRLTSPTTVQVAGSEGAPIELEAGHILLATGSEPAPLAVPPVRRQDGRRLDGGPLLRAGPRPPGGGRRRLHRAGAGLGLEAAGIEGHGHRVPSPHRPHGRRRDR